MQGFAVPQLTANALYMEHSKHLGSVGNSAKQDSE